MWESLESAWREVALFFAALWLSVVTWIGNQYAARVIRLEQDKANKDSTDKRFDQFYGAFENHVKENRQSHDAIKAEVSKAAVTLAKIETKLEERTK